MTAIKTTYYVRDAQSNIMASYTQTNTQEIALEEQPIYGSSRLGVYHPTTETGIVRGNRIYEGSNHLGNVLVTFSDRIVFENGDLKPAINSHSDYYAFGMPIKTRTNAARLYKFAFQGQEAENELYGEGNASFFKFRVSDNRIGRFFAVDPLYAKYAYNSTYAFSENRVIDGVELEGKEVLLIGNLSSYSLFYSVGYEEGILIAPDGVFAYSSKLKGSETNVSLNTELSSTYFPTMKTYKDAMGSSTMTGVAGNIGLFATAAISASSVNSNGHIGTNVTVGGSLSLLPISISTYSSVTEVLPISKLGNKNFAINLLKQNYDILDDKQFELYKQRNELIYSKQKIEKDALKSKTWQDYESKIKEADNIQNKIDTFNKSIEEIQKQKNMIMETIKKL